MAEGRVEVTQAIDQVGESNLISNTNAPIRVFESL